MKNNVENKLNVLLNDVVANVPYYKTFFHKQKLNTLNINCFPIIDKSIIKENSKIFFNNRLKHKNYLIETTSGSTGVPLKIYRTEEERYILSLSLIKERSKKIGEKLNSKKIAILTPKFMEAYSYKNKKIG